MTEPVKGGYRPPAKPAAASGPGKLSRRTDGQPLVQLPDAAYGEQKTFQEAQRAAPMAQGRGPGQGSMPGVDMSRIVPLDAPSQYPDEPVTSGADAGAGPGSAVLGGAGDYSVEGLLPLLPALEVAASSPNATPFFRTFVRMLRSRA